MLEKKSIPILSIVAAKSGTGKTTLIEQLVGILQSRGYRIGVLKHDAHKFEIDHRGKDSWRFTQAGARKVIISSPEKLAMVQLLEKELSLEELLAFYHDVDLVLVEGYKKSNYPKIEVYRKGLNQGLLYEDSAFDPGSFLALASDEPLNLPVIVLDLNNWTAIADFIERKFLSEKRGDSQ